MFCNAGKPYHLTDYLDVIVHGAGLDATTTGYVTAFPFLLTLVSVWVHRLPMHCFDADMVKGQKIVVRTQAEGT